MLWSNKKNSDMEYKIKEQEIHINILLKENAELRAKHLELINQQSQKKENT